MARARNLKPSFFTDDEIAKLKPLTRLLFQGLWCIADREGRLQDKPAKIKVEVLPYDKCSINQMLCTLNDARFIVRYERDGQKFIQVRRFSKHQNPHIKEPESTIPAPDSAPYKNGTSTVQDTELAREIPERAGRIPDSGFPLIDSLNRIPVSGSPPPVSGLPQPAIAADAKSEPPANAGKGNPTTGLKNLLTSKPKGNGQGPKPIGAIIEQAEPATVPQTSTERREQELRRAELLRQAEAEAAKRAH